MVVCWRYGMPFDANGCISTLVDVDWITGMYFCVSEFERQQTTINTILLYIRDNKISITEGKYLA